MARYEDSCAVHFEEGPDGDCRYAVGCFSILCENSAYHYVNIADRNVLRMLRRHYGSSVYAADRDVLDR